MAYRAKKKKETDLKVARFDGDVWQYQVVEASVEARYVSLAIDLAGAPAIAYSDDADGDNTLDTLKYARWSGVSWDIEVVRTGTDGFGVYASLAFDPSSASPGLPAISQSVSSAGYAVQLLQRTGTGTGPAAWTDETVESGRALSSSLAFDSTGTAYVAYEWLSDTQELPDEVRVARRDGPGSYFIEVAGYGSPVISGRTPIAVDPADAPAVVFPRRLDPEDLRFASRRPSLPCGGPTDCDDQNACTTEQCLSETCAYTAVDCDDNDACTVDSCDPSFGCSSVPISCDDGDDCTIDSCDTVTGCAHDYPACGLADDCCGPACTDDPDCTTCAPQGEPCVTASDCCSNKCKGKPGRKTCS